MVCFQNSNPLSADIIPQRQPYSEFSPTSTLPSIKIRSPSLPSSIPRCQCGVWYCGPRNPSRASLHFIRTLRYGVRMAGVVHHWPRTYNLRWQPPHTFIQGSLWRSSGISIRTGFICPLHIECSQTCRGTWPWCSPLCRWHPTLWPLFTCQLFWVGVSRSSSY